MVIQSGLVIVTVPASMAALGHYQAVVQVQLDGTPTYKTEIYEYSIQPVLPVTP